MNSEQARTATIGGHADLSRRICSPDRLAPWPAGDEAAPRRQGQDQPEPSRLSTGHSHGVRGGHPSAATQPLTENADLDYQTAVERTGELQWDCRMVGCSRHGIAGLPTMPCSGPAPLTRGGTTHGRDGPFLAHGLRQERPITTAG